MIRPMNFTRRVVILKTSEEKFMYLDPEPAVAYGAKRSFSHLLETDSGTVTVYTKQQFAKEPKKLPDLDTPVIIDWELRQVFSKHRQVYVLDKDSAYRDLIHDEEIYTGLIYIPPTGD